MRSTAPIFLFATLLAATTLSTACTWQRERKPAVNPHASHTHADFAIWIDGVQLDFSDPKHLAETQKAHEHHGDAEEPAHHDSFHLHEGASQLMHRHRPGESFGTFLKVLEMKLTSECLTLEDGKRVCTSAEKQWRMFVNGEEVPVDPNFIFEDTATILLTYGASAKDIQKQLEAMTDDACIYSRTCPWRGEPPSEDCVSDPEIPCMAPLE